MESRMAVWAIGMLLLTLLGGENGGVAGSGSGNKCRFPAIFNFGDSNSDTGESSSAFGETLLPNGVTHGSKFKRACDGRLIIDFIAEYLGLPYLNSPLDSIGTSFNQGANFATGGVKMSPVLMQYTRPFYLDVQVSQFLLFKSRTTDLYKQLSNNGNNPTTKSIIPKPTDFSKALYTIDIGQNDIAFNFDLLPISTVLDNFSNSVQRLLREGAKFLWVHNTGPFGCLARTVEYRCGGPKPCLSDEHGCVKDLNEKAQELNRQLKERVYKLRAQYPDATITYVDIYSAKYKLISDAKNQGFDEPFKYCCGNSTVWCGDREANGIKPINHERGTVIGTACNDPSKHISWDGVHYSEAANRFVADLILNGSFSDPPVPIAEPCPCQKPL